MEGAGGNVWSQVGWSGKVAAGQARPGFTFVRGRMGADGWPERGEERRCTEGVHHSYYHTPAGDPEGGVGRRAGGLVKGANRGTGRWGWTAILALGCWGMGKGQGSDKYKARCNYSWISLLRVGTFFDTYTTTVEFELTKIKYFVIDWSGKIGKS